MAQISIHSLLAEGDGEWMIWTDGRAAISIHSLLAEGDLIMRHTPYAQQNFNPLPPRGGRRLPARPAPAGCVISIHSLLAEGDAHELCEAMRKIISIHSLLAEGDYRPPPER